jgi:hypothetical protein
LGNKRRRPVTWKGDGPDSFNQERKAMGGVILQRA